jgi:hypothetical protein
MIRAAISFGFLFAFIFVDPLAAQDAVKSGPQKGDLIPGTFHPFNVSGKFGIQRDMKGEIVQHGRHHCLVCDFGLKPVALIFAHEPQATKDEAFLELLKKLEAVMAKDHDSLYRGCVVFLSPHAASSVYEGDVPEDKRNTDTKLLQAEALKRQELTDHLEKFAVPFKNFVVAHYPEPGPESFKLSEKAEVTVILYIKHRVAANFAFGPGQLTPQAIEQVARAAAELIGRGKKEDDKAEK